MRIKRLLHHDAPRLAPRLLGIPNITYVTYCVAPDHGRHGHRAACERGLALRLGYRDAQAPALGARCSVLDNAQAGRVTTVQREAARFAVVDAEQLLRS